MGICLFFEIAYKGTKKMSSGKNLFIISINITRKCAHAWVRWSRIFFEPDKLPFYGLFCELMLKLCFKAKFSAKMFGGVRRSE